MLAKPEAFELFSKEVTAWFSDSAVRDAQYGEGDVFFRLGICFALRQRRLNSIWKGPDLKSSAIITTVSEVSGAATTMFRQGQHFVQALAA